jgi:hypothetical protein
MIVGVLPLEEAKAAMTMLRTGIGVTFAIAP